MSVFTPVTEVDSGLWVDQSQTVKEALVTVSPPRGLAELSRRYRDVHPEITDIRYRCFIFYGTLKRKAGCT